MCTILLTMMILTAFFVLVVYLLISLNYRRSYLYWNRKNIPIKKHEYFIGGIFGVLFGQYSSANYISSLCNVFKEPYFVFFALNKSFMVVKDPNVIKRILVCDFKCFSDKIFHNDKDFDPVFSNSLFNLKTDVWKRYRAHASLIFRPQKVKLMVMMAKHCGEDLCQYLKKKLNANVDVKDITIRYSTEVISTCAFGINANCFKEGRNAFSYNAHHVFPKSYEGTFKGFTYVFTPQLVRIFKYPFFNSSSCNFFREVFLDVIRQRREMNFKRYDLVDILMELKENNKENIVLEENRMLAQAIVFLAVGHETLATIVALTVYQLSLNENIQTCLRAEINEVTERYGDITPGALEEMKYLQMVIFETLRMYPVIPFIQRKCIKDCVIPETGTVLEKGTSILIPTHWLHSNELYFPEPQKYIPERFDKINKHIIHPYAYLPFSAGPRSCLGKRFALMNLKVCIIYFVKHFKMEIDSSRQVKFGSSHATETIGSLPIKLYKL